MLNVDCVLACGFSTDPAGLKAGAEGDAAQVTAGSQLRHATLRSLAFERPTGADEKAF